jgi:hypothetical protein
LCRGEKTALFCVLGSGGGGVDHWKSFAKNRGGQTIWGVEGYPEIGCPLDPGLGLGGIYQYVLILGKIKPYFCEFPDS